MKKVLLILSAIFMAGILFSCYKDNEDSVDSTVKKYSGKWKATESYYDGKWTDITYMGWYGEVNEDGSYKVYLNGDTYSGTWKLSGMRATCDVTPSYDIDPYQVYIDIIEFDDSSAVVDFSYVEDPNNPKIKERYKIVKY
ncbi:MAG: hypothetical protein ACOYEA_04925 [Fermentimonas sp.]|jgi:hypothetical protein